MSRRLKGQIGLMGAVRASAPAKPDYSEAGQAQRPAPTDNLGSPLLRRNDPLQPGRNDLGRQLRPGVIEVDQVIEVFLVRGHFPGQVDDHDLIFPAHFPDGVVEGVIQLFEFLVADAGSRPSRPM